MIEQKFNIGDAVQHKSGGPKMIVKGFAQDEVVCEWFDKEHRVQEKAFHHDTLKPYEGRVYTSVPRREDRGW